MDDWIGTLTALLPGLLFIALGWPLSRRRIPPNHWYGYRTPTTRSNPAIWYPVNEAGGRHLIRIGAIAMAVGLIGAATHGNIEAQRYVAWTAMSVLVGGMGMSIVITQRLAHRIKRELAESSAPNAHS